MISLFFGRVAKKLSTVHFKLSTSLWQAITTLTAQVIRPLFSSLAPAGSAQGRRLVSCLGLMDRLKVLQDSADPVWSFRHQGRPQCRDHCPGPGVGGGGGVVGGG